MGLDFKGGVWGWVGGVVKPGASAVKRGKRKRAGGEVVNGNPKTFHSLRPRTHGNVSLRFCIVSSNELVVLDCLENSKQYEKRRETFPCVRGLSFVLFRRFSEILTFGSC